MATAAIERPQCRTSPSAHQALKQHFAEHPEDKLHHPHKWDVSRSDIYAENTWHPIFREMREAGPLHYIDDSPFGPYWAVVGHKAIQHIEALPDTFSSSWEHGGITILERLTDEQLAERGLDERRELPMFIAMDRPQHTGQRRTVAPKFTPSGMAEMEGEIRQRTGELLDSLPRGEVFDWVDTVSIELTTGMLAILFGFPWEDRRLLTFWSDWSGDTELATVRELDEVRWGILQEMAAYFQSLWIERTHDKEPGDDLISMMIHSEAMNQMSPQEFMGNLILLIVGCFMETVAAITILTPVLLPIAMQMGVDPVHFGIIMMLNLGIGLVTPPVGSVLFVGSAVGKIPVTKLVRTIWPFYLTLIAALALVTYVPFLSLWLPSVFAK